MSNIQIKRHGLMFILSSPSGAGKTTLARHLLDNSDNLVMSVSVTTRLKRPEEREGIDYYFINKHQYDTMILNNELLEHARVFSYYYGTPRQKIEEILANGIDVLFDVDWQGAAQLKKKAPDQVVSVFILPPSMKVLEQRLRGRNQDLADVLQERMAGASNEISNWVSYDYVIINDNIEDSMKKIMSILEAERLKRKRQIGLDDFINELLS
ncbi:Guanylate kinase [Rickettsiales bacterium Ac37b]|nr:Guanylate kinase [Rickettsiales bacterium Ac37b]